MSRTARIARATIAAAVLTIGAAPAAHAQTVAPEAAQQDQAHWEFVIPGGQLIPTGDQRANVQRGGMTAAQLSYVPRPSLAFTATFAWARSRDVASVDRPKLDVFMYDIGAEVRAPRWIGGGKVTFSPFAGVGGGARSYNYRSLHVDATHNLAAYASAGGEIGVGRVHLRVEARDYVARFQALDGQGSSHTRNDVALLFGLRFGTR